MKNLIVISLLVCIFWACKKKDNARFINTWKVVSFVENLNAIAQIPTQTIYIQVLPNQQITLFNPNMYCSGYYTQTKGKFKTDALGCDSCCVHEIEKAIQSNFHKFNRFDIQENTLYFLGDQQLSLKAELHEE